MANERVSQLLEIFANDLATSDLFLLTDVSEKESKKLQLGQLLAYIENSGSFDVEHATSADTASYILGSGVFGPVTSASYAAKASNSDSASFSNLALYSFLCTLATQSLSASYLIGGVGSVASASHALRADYADNAGNAAFLYYSGVNNGTASLGLTASYSDNLIIWGTAFPTGSEHGITMYGGSNDGVTIAMSGSLDNGQLYIRTFDNGTEPIRFQGYKYDAIPPTVERALLTSDTGAPMTAKFTVYGDISASAFTASRDSGIGFVGTASYVASASNAITASYATSTPVYRGPTFFNPVVITSSVTGILPYTTFNCAPYVPVGTQVVILDGWSSNGNTNTQGFVNIRTGSGAPVYILLSYRSAGGGDANSFGGQGSFPVSSSLTFQYNFSQAADGGTTLRLIGYY